MIENPEQILIKKVLPPQVTLLSIIAKYGSITLMQLYAILKEKARSNPVLNYNTLNELVSDLNMLHILGLIREEKGVYSITEKGLTFLRKFMKSVT